MKKSIFIFLLLPLVIACTSIGNNAQKNVALIEKYVNAVENLEYEIMESLLADDYKGLGPSIGDSIGKADAVSMWKENVENLYEKIEYQRSRNVPVNIPSGENQGDWVANWGELHIVYKENMGEVTIWANTIYQIENNKIVKSYTFYNEADALRQLGYFFIHPSDL